MGHQRKPFKSAAYIFYNVLQVSNKDLKIAGVIQEDKN